MPSLVRSSRRNRHKPSNDVDRISNLPEAILSHILSYLPAEEAVATSLVSRRWKNLWTNIHNLRFSDYIDRFKDNKIKFSHFVSKVLIFNNQQSIKEFSLSIEEYCEMYDVTTWIASAVARNLKKLEFRNQYYETYYSDPLVQLPSSIFACRTLEVLVLTGNMSLYLPSLVCLPKLKSLTLDAVDYEGDESVCNLISGCSSLKRLCIEREGYDNVITFSVSSPTLRKLILRFTDSTTRPFPPELPYKLEINAPALRYFYLRDEVSRDFSIENLCLLDEAIIQTRRFVHDKELNDSAHYPKVVKLLQGVSNVKHLTLQPPTIEALSRVDQLPSFPRLTEWEGQYCGWSLLLELVKGMNNLEFLTLSQMNTSLPCWSKPEELPICFSSCLQEMEITGFSGQEDELALVAYILKNAKELRTVIINANSGLDLEVRYELLQKVLRFPRGSEECEIEFSAELDCCYDLYKRLDYFIVAAYFDDISSPIPFY